MAGVGNIFLADDAFGCEVLRALAADPLPSGADAVDFGIRGMDLAYRLLAGYDAAVLVDAAPGARSPARCTSSRRTCRRTEPSRRRTAWTR